jgi:hypothetical protein
VRDAGRRPAAGGGRRAAVPALITDELARRKLAEGLYDYDDMINGVAEALAGDAGDAWSSGCADATGSR